MPNNAISDGWKRFLDRLKRLWGRQRDDGFARPSAVACGGYEFAAHA
jgi:hypothetical protein